MKKTKLATTETKIVKEIFGVEKYAVVDLSAEFCEDRKGRIKENYYADIVILDKDIFTVDPMEIRNIKPIITMVGGKIVYSQK